MENKKRVERAIGEAFNLEIEGKTFRLMAIEGKDCDACFMNRHCMSDAAKLNLDLFGFLGICSERMRIDGIDIIFYNITPMEQDKDTYTRRIGETFGYQDNTMQKPVLLQVKESVYCCDCYFEGKCDPICKRQLNITGACSSLVRTDKASCIFEQVTQ